MYYFAVMPARVCTFSGCAIIIVWTLVWSFAAPNSWAQAVAVLGCPSDTLKNSVAQSGVGLVPICLNDTVWSTVCTSGHTEPSTISVACRQLGYSVLAASEHSSSSSGPGVSVQCTGRESSLLNCSISSLVATCSQLSLNCTGGIPSPCSNQYQCWSEDFCIPSAYLCDSISDCAGGLDESNCPSLVTCQSGDIRLTGGMDYFGRVEVCTSAGSFAAILDTDWNVLDASVVCRQLNRNFSGGIPVPIQPGNGPTVSFLISCNGKESNLTKCAEAAAGLGTSQTPHAVGVLCKVNASCQDGDLRLVGGVGPREGQVEVCYNGMWGHMCSPVWSYANAAVVCRQLGYSPAGAIPLIYRNFNAYASPILMGNVYCTGTETLLAKCTIFSQLGLQNENQTLTCDSFDHIGVRCDDYQPTGCSEGSVRLTERATPGSGKLQLCLNNTWSEFCAIGMDSRATSAVCRQLGYVAGYSQYSSTANSHPQAYLVLNCSGTDRNLLQCIKGFSDSISCFTGSVYVQCSELYVVFTPSVPSVYTLQSDQSFHLGCIAKGTGALSVIGYYNQSGFQTPVGVMDTVDLLNGIQRADQVVYGCIVTNKVETVSANVTLRIASASGDQSDAFWRGSIPAIFRITHVLGSLTSAQFLSTLAQLFTDGASVFPGLWTAKCYNVSKQQIDIDRNLDRIECRISCFSSNLTDQVYPPFSVAVDAVGVAQAYVSAQLGGLGGPSQLSITVISRYQFCDSSVTTSPQGNYSWPEASGISVVNLPCAFGPNSNTVSRVCSLNGVWQAPDLTRCSTAVSDLFRKLGSIILDGQNIADVSQSLVDGVTMAGVAEQSLQNIAFVGDILNQKAGLIQNMSNSSFLTIAKQVTRNAVAILDVVQGWPRETIALQGNGIVQSLERMLTGIAQNSIFTNFMTSGKTIAVDAEKVDLNDAIVNGQHFTASNGSAGINVNTRSSSSVATSLASVSLPASLFTLLAPGSRLSSGSTPSIGVLITVYSTAAFFPLRRVNNSVINSPVVGASVVVNSSMRAISGLTDPVQINLNLTDTDNTSFTNPRCVFWDYTAAGGQGNWSEGGCKTILVGTNSVRCECTHLTNFACLVDIGARTGDDTSEISTTSQQSLSVLSIIGVTLSLLGLIITLITFILFKKIRDKDTTKLHIQLCAAMFCMYAVFLFGIGLDKANSEDFGITIDKTENIGACVAVSVMIQYFTLVVFMVMAAEALLMFQKLVLVFVQITVTYQVVNSFVCWVLPLVPVIIPLAIDKNYLITKPDNITGDEGYCFISHAGVFFGAFIGPIFAIVLLNCAIFVIVTAVLIKHTLEKSKSKHKKTHTTVRLIIAIGGLTILFGISWAFSVGTVLKARLAFSILFVVFNAFQGFLVFLMFCVFSTDAQQAWRSLVCKGSLSTVPVSRTSHGQSTKYGERVELPASHGPSHKLQSFTSSPCAKERDETSLTSAIEELSSNLRLTEDCHPQSTNTKA